MENLWKSLQAVLDVALPLLYLQSISAQLGDVAGGCVTMGPPTSRTSGYFPLVPCAK